ncbi:MAG: periplasmic heavy metal sensor [Polyangiaceae bacterium]|nr:periplasmic heavy metal sensor [Polyangiaceae bacterium]
MFQKFTKTAAVWVLGAGCLLLGSLTSLAHGQNADNVPVRAAKGGSHERPRNGKHGERWRELEGRLAKVRERVLTEQVGLDATRKAQVEKTLLKFHAKKRELGKQLREQQQEVRRLVAADSQDQGAFTRLLAAMDTTTEAIHRLRREEGTELAQVMTPKERAKLGLAMQRVQHQMRGAFRRYQERSLGKGPRDNQATDSK